MAEVQWGMSRSSHMLPCMPTCIAGLDAQYIHSLHPRVPNTHGLTPTGVAIGGSVVLDGHGEVGLALGRRIDIHVSAIDDGIQQLGSCDLEAGVARPLH
eukprot:CAMPEP_0181198802 /NCGR_PEP_ID=MMETSP1096-20121128/16825_1 /TAXON_ID=156174 ORGANISM="Chrysochromulina ericina, Strain CCMP281" /NCGR_SAMPLE_ID=MMETSP1096 /ASSEMBLY_ACC=CAM_ASM_000453 /LENGTH=98 /DNA_ID=CAMNT_0023288917 /DNA_START=295 /DNA_END=591 /DNA_ORIENTATION=+